MFEDNTNQNLYPDLIDNHPEPQSTYDQELEHKIQRLRNEAEVQKQRTWSFYQNLKASDPRKYWLPKTQAQMHKDSAKLGDKFEDGNFHD
jgi:hypothetical protein